MPHSLNAKPVCLTADDYGLSAGINASIEALAEAGRLSAVSVMAHRDADWSSLDRLAAMPVSLGLHLCFTGERPLLARLGERFPRDYRDLFAELLRNRALLSLLEEEAELQFERLQKAGIEVAFLNGHEHVHLFPPLWPVFARLAKRTRIRAVRAALGQPVGLSKSGALAMASRLSFRLFPLEQVQILSPLGVGLAGALSPRAAEMLLGRPFSALPRVVPEICIHPALDGSGRRAEHEMVASGALSRIVEARGLTMMRDVGRS